MNIYLLIAGIFGGWSMGYMACDRGSGTWKENAAEFAIAIVFAALWPIVLIAGPVLWWMSRQDSE